MSNNNDGVASRPHILIDAFRELNEYEFPSSSVQRKAIRDNYQRHAKNLLSQLAQALENQSQSGRGPLLKLDGIRPGNVVEIRTLPVPKKSRKEAFKIPASLFPAKDITVLRTQRNPDKSESASVFIPDHARDFLRDRINAYGAHRGPGRRPDVEQFESLEEITSDYPLSLFGSTTFPSNTACKWWEVWVRDPSTLADQLGKYARDLGIDVHRERLYFPDTTVILLHASFSEIVEFAARAPGAITEIRPLHGSISIFLNQSDVELSQHDWMEDLLKRTVLPPSGASRICVLDTGVASGHPLLSPALAGSWAYDDEWGVDDHYPKDGHGTQLAGLVVYGDLEFVLDDRRQIYLTHFVESMKLLPPEGFKETEPPMYGTVTQGAVAKVEIEFPDHRRAFCLATSTSDFTSERPSSWSGALDQLAAGAMAGDYEECQRAADSPKRLILVATGNVQGGPIDEVLPLGQLEDPSQSWNSITVGGFTQKEQILHGDLGLVALVSANNRSPYSRGSTELPCDLVPIKPEVLFESGNMLVDDSGLCGFHESVSLVSTGSRVFQKPLTAFWATSAAVGMAGNFVGRMRASLPDLWPETIRALMVDSARWPKPVRKKFIGRGAHWRGLRKQERQNLLREFGYGVPNLERAIHSARNELSLVAQSEIQPYKVSDSGNVVFNELHFYALPWPTEQLQKLEGTTVTMRVTLSYFVEPNLAGKAATRPESYRSFGLRFEMKKRAETKRNFKARITKNQNSQTESVDEACYWLLGPRAMRAGSLHCDIWRGDAVDLALHDAIAVYPVSGWWKTHAGQQRFLNTGRYALVVSISAPEVDVDLYAEVTSKVTARVTSSEVEVTT